MTEMQQRRFVSSALLVLTIGVAVLAAVGGTSNARTICTVCFYLLVPGCAVVGAVGLVDRGLELAAGVALSVALAIVASEVMLWTGAWHPYAEFVVLAAMSVPLLVLRIVRPEPSGPLRPTRGRDR